MITDPETALKVQLEFWGRLKTLGVRICFTGDMDVPKRWEALRRAIIAADMADRLAGKTETFAHAFKRATGTSLINHTETIA